MHAPSSDPARDPPRANAPADEAPPAAAGTSAALPPLLQPALLLISAALVVLMLWSGREILVPLALGALLAFVLDPLVDRLARRQVPRGLAVGLVVTGTVLAIGASSVFVGGQAVALGRDMPTYQATMQTKLRTLRQQMSGRGVLDDLGRMIEVVSGELDATRRALVAHAGAAPERQALRVEIAPSRPSVLQALGTLIEPVLAPAASAGLVLLFLLFILLDRNDLRDRALRLFGGDLHRSTAALKEASDRVSRYLTMQVLVNSGYGLALAGGLALIGVPGALLWGALGGVLRFVPYIGPLVASVGPLLLAFAIDPGWQLLLSAALLVLTLEVLINNAIEPWLYGSSTGLSPTALLVSAAFWTGLWGPVGLVLATPVTVLIVVIGRHIPGLQWLDLLLGSTPAFDPATRLYQRLLAGDVEEATQLAIEQARQQGPQAFYGSTGMPVLRLAAAAAHQASGAEQRHRLLQGVAQMLDELAEDGPAPGPGMRADGPPPHPAEADVVCIGGRWQADALAARMCAHALALQGVTARALPPSALLAARLEQAPLARVRLVVLGYVDRDSTTHARYVCRRLRRRWPQLRIILARWDADDRPGPVEGRPGPTPVAAFSRPWPAGMPPANEPDDPDDPTASTARTLGADVVVRTLDEAVLQVHAMGSLNPRAEPDTPAAAPPGHDAPADAGGPPATATLLDTALRPLLALTAQRSADLFDVAHSAVLLWADDGRLLCAADQDDVLGRIEPEPRDGTPPEPATPPAAADALARDVAETVRTLRAPVHIDDVARDARHAALAAGLARAPRSCTAVPLRPTAEAPPVGVLWLSDPRPRTLREAERALLQSLAAELMGQLTRLQAVSLAGIGLPPEAAATPAAPATPATKPAAAPTAPPATQGPCAAATPPVAPPAPPFPACVASG
ncbi:MAG: hypothetical protein RIQ53_3149 [Pseudomonadota bacterium]|jgi:predicted PurR-regulated permease PerM